MIKRMLLFRCLLSAAALLLPGACVEKAPDITPELYQCQTTPQQAAFSQNEVVRATDAEITDRLGRANLPDAQGALGRNQAAYFHVRFQVGVGPLMDYALARENPATLDQALRTFEYSFRHQRPAGDFLLAIPPDLAAAPPPTAADLASSVAFFLAAAGPALLACEESGWYRTAPGAAPVRARAEALQPRVQLAAAWLGQQQATLAAYDSLAPNRLFFDALAYYSLGRYLREPALQQAGLRFARRAVARQQGRGYYEEGGGHDSSYQGVALAQGCRLLALLPATEPFRQELWNSLACAADWQAARVLASGEISTQGNTRVYPGGETFLGAEKQVAWTSTLLAFWSLHLLSGQARYRELAQQLVAYYG